ncbi:MAG TPA: A24 family peptidase [Caproicibacter sp.]|nr:A24 family peptidase [Caproicibacter sp.]
MVYLAALASGIVVELILRRCLCKNPRFPFVALIFVLTCSVLLRASDDPVTIVKGFFLSIGMIVISVYDGLTHNIPNVLMLPLLAIGLIGFNPSMSLLGLIAGFLPFLLIALLTKGNIGGGDIKLMAATGFAIGPAAVIAGVLIGLTASMPYRLISRLHHHQKLNPYALAPWLCSGCFVAYLLNH